MRPNSTQAESAVLKMQAAVMGPGVRKPRDAAEEETSFER